MKRLLIFILVVQSLLSYNSFAQQSSSSYIKSGQMNSNNVITMFTNSGVIGQPNNIGPMVSWKYDHNGYFGDLSFMIGVELPIKDYNGDGTPDTLHEVIITPVSRPGGGKGTVNQFYGFEPDSGFFNPNLNVQGEGIAISTLPETWPVIWPDHPEYGQNVWNGFFGKDSSAGDQEAYFQVDDRSDATYYNLYKFLPVSNDTTRYGFGITVNVRYIELKNPLFQDVLFRVYDIKNESNYNYSKIVFGNLAGTYVGGAGDEYTDDAAFYDSTNNIIYVWDKEPGKGFPYVRPEANPFWKPNPYVVGTAGETFLQAPGNNRIANYNYFSPSGAISMSNQIDMWNRLTKFPNASRASDTLTGEDADYIYGSNIFSLNSGETKRIVTALVFGNDKQDVLSKTQLALALWNNNFKVENVNNRISILEPVSHNILKGTETISWTSNYSGGYVDIWYSPDAGDTWKNIVTNNVNNGSYSWKTNLYSDCTFGKLKFLIKDNNKNLIGINESNYFSIDNSGSSSPYIKILNNQFSPDSVFTNSVYNFNLLIGSNKNDSLLCKVYYSTANDTNLYLSQTFFVRPDTSVQLIPVNFNDITNSTQLKIKLEVTDGNSSWSAATPYFNKQTPRQSVDSTNYKKVSWHSQVKIKIIKVDPSKFTGDNYQITFDDTSSLAQKTLSVYDLTKQKYVLSNVPLIPFTESPVFDGLSLYNEDITTSIDSSRSGWNKTQPNNLNYILTQLVLMNKNLVSIRYPFDYMFVFSNSYNDSSNSLQVFKDNGINLPTKKTNFNIYDITNKNNPIKVQYAMTETTKQDTLSANDIVFISDSAGKALSWRVMFTGGDTSHIPNGGDTLYLYTQKGLSFYDTLNIFGLISDVKIINQIPLTFKLEQNYPNPFNPSTIIQYNLPKTSKVSLKIYDILGRVVGTLVNGTQNAGKYSIEFNASRYASGVYFYRLQAGDNVSIKKMVLLK